MRRIHLAAERWVDGETRVVIGCPAEPTTLGSGATSRDPDEVTCRACRRSYLMWEVRFYRHRNMINDAAHAVALENRTAHARRRKRALRAWQRGDASAVETVRALGYRGFDVIGSNPELVRAHIAEKEAAEPPPPPPALLMSRTRPARAGAKLGRVRLHLLARAT